MKNTKTIALAFAVVAAFAQQASAEVFVELDKKYDCIVDETSNRNSYLFREKGQKRLSIAKLTKRLRKQLRNRRLPRPKRQRISAFLRKVNQCRAQKGNYNPDNLIPAKTGPAFAKATLIPTGTGIAAKCNLVIQEDSATEQATGGAIYCSINGLVSAGSASFFLWGDGEVWSQALTNILVISPNGQFNNISVDLDAQTAQSAREYLRGKGSKLRGSMRLNGSTGQTFEFDGDFEETSGAGDCRLQASIQGQGNSGQVFLDLADGSIEVQLGDQTSFLTFINIFAGNTPNSPTVGQFGIPQAIIDVLPQSTFSFSLSPEELVRVQNAVREVSRELTVGIPQSSVDKTLVGRFTEPQTSCEVVN